MIDRFMQAAQYVKKHGGYRAASRVTGIPESTLRARVKKFSGPATSTKVEPVEDWIKSYSEKESISKENTLLRSQLQTRHRQHEGLMRAIENVFDKNEIVVNVNQPSNLKKSSNKPKHIPAMVLSDTQIGKNTGSYSIAVSHERIKTLAKKQLRVLEVMRSGADIPYVEIWLGGDMVEGERIFPNQTWEIECGAGRQACIHAPQQMAEYILAFAAAGYRVKVRSILGNHGRVSSPRDPASDSANWDLVSYHVTKGLCESNSISKEITNRITWPDGITEHWYNVIRMPGEWGVMLTHGHMISGGGASSTIEKKVQGWLNGAVPEKFDYVVMGHFHRAIEWPVGTCEVIINGTTETPESAFLQGIVASTNRSFQRMLVFHEEHGLINNHKFYLDGLKPKALS